MLDNYTDSLTPKSVVILVAAIFTAQYLVRRISNERKISKLGGHAPSLNSFVPFGIDLLYNAIKATMAYQNLELWESWFNKYGRYTVELNLGTERSVYTAEPENVKAILATQFDDYGKGEQFHSDFKAFLGDGVFVTDGDQWYQSRQLLRPQFIKDRVSDLEIFEEHVQVLMNAIGNGGVGFQGRGVAKGKEIDVSNLFFRYTLDSATHFLLGSSVDSLLVERQSFAEAFQEVQRVQSILQRAGPLRAFVPRSSFHSGLKVLNDYANPFIEQVLNLTPEELAAKTKTDSGYTFLHALAGFTRDRKVLRDQIVTVLLAGRDTTASTLSWLFYEISKQPDIVKKLRAEIIEVVGLQRPPTYADLKSMKYLQYTLNETLRIYPIVPFNVRHALKDTTLPRGGGPDGKSPVGVLKGTPIGFSTLNMQRRADLYPETDPSDPLHYLKFNPDRWFNWHPKMWTYIPFNGGPRICLGQQFALTNASYTIVRLLQRFDRVESYMDKIDGGNPCLKAEIVMQPGQGVMVGFWEAN